MAGRSKCNDCEVNSKNIEKQINIVTIQDNQLQDSHQIQRDKKKAVRDLKKKLEDAVKLVEDLTRENTNVRRIMLISVGCVQLSTQPKIPLRNT